VEDAECNLITCKLPKKILPMQAQNAHKILLNKLFNAHKKKNIRHNRNRKPYARQSSTSYLYLFLPSLCITIRTRQISSAGISKKHWEIITNIPNTNSGTCYWSTRLLPSSFQAHSNARRSTNGKITRPKRERKERSERDHSQLRTVYKNVCTKVRKLPVIR